MFELREFVMQSLREMVQYELAYKVRQYALGPDTPDACCGKPAT